MSDLKFFESSMQMPLAKLTLRSTLVPLSNNKSVLISPIQFLQAQLTELNKTPPTDIVAPNSFHHLYIEQAHKHYPQSRLHATANLQKKRADIAWSALLDEKNWPYQNELVLVALTGAPKFSEVAFFHQQSKSLIVTDLFFNLKNLSHWSEKLVYGLMGTYNKPNVSRLMKALTKDKSALKESLLKILEFDFDRLIMAHGEIIQTGGKKLLTEALKERQLI